MDDDEKADIARGGLGLLDKAETLRPDAIAARLNEAAANTAKGAVLGGVRAVSNLLGTSPKRPRVGPSAEAVERTLAALEANSAAEFDERLRGAASRAASEARAAEQREADVEAQEAAALARLRRSFPPESKELAVLLFSCVDLLEDLAEVDHPPSASELARKELLIARIGALLAPHASVSLASFVGHVVALSREKREK